MNSQGTEGWLPPYLTGLAEANSKTLDPTLCSGNSTKLGGLGDMRDFAKPLTPYQVMSPIVSGL
jgi:hypothetical protein